MRTQLDVFHSHHKQQRPHRALGGGTALVAAAFQAGQAIFTFAAMFLGIFLIAASEAIRRTRVLPRWIGYLGLVAGAAYVAGSFSVADQRGPLALPALLGFVLFIVWTLAISVVLIVRGPSKEMPHS